MTSARTRRGAACSPPTGDPVPARFDALLDAEGVDTALLFAEYSPRATGIQPVEDLLPLIAHNPARFRLVANVNPDVHPEPAAEAARQLGLGAVAVKLHPVHGAFSPEDPALRAVYELCAERGVPVITHTGGSIFPGSEPSAGDPHLMRQVIADFPGVAFVLAHGGRGQWYNEAAEMALSCENVWLDLAGLPPKRLPDYYAAFDLPALARKWIFGTDWPGVPGIARNVRALAALGPPRRRSPWHPGHPRHPRLPPPLAAEPAVYPDAATGAPPSRPGWASPRRSRPCCPPPRPR